MKLVFDSMSELRSFLDEYDGDGSDDAAEAATGTATTRRRRGPNKSKGEAPAPNNPNVAGNGAATTAGFAPPPTGQAAAPQTGFPAGPAAATGFPGAPPQQQVHPLVAQIAAKVDATLLAGAPVDPMVAWFRTALPGAEQANWEQIKASFLPKAPEPVLVNIASQMGIVQQSA